VIITHAAGEKAMQRAVTALDRDIAKLESMIRVEQE